MKSALKLFKREFARCRICAGDYYGFAHEPSSLSISGYFEGYFCRQCIDKNCASGRLDERSLGKTYIITNAHGKRNRIASRR